MHMQSVSRRRFIEIAAATAATLSDPASAKPETGWRGTLMGARAQIEIQGLDESLAQALMRRSLAEARRLERIFSLYRDDSVLSQCNRDGFVLAPPLEFVNLLQRCQALHRQTHGRFDPTIQPLWAFYASHFSGPSKGAPDASAVLGIRGRIGMEKIIVTNGRVMFTQPGMALTFNGIAQGFITDRIATLLTDAGLAHCLVDLGEIRATGTKSNGEAWAIGIAAPDNGQRIVRHWPLRSGAIATSSGNGFAFTPDGIFNHILDPAGTRCARIDRSISVMALDATTADGLSTAFALMSDDEIHSCLKGFPDVSALVLEGHDRSSLIGQG